MATTTGSHSVASFTAPVNGTSPIDANAVRNNDNSLRTAYVDHDSDPGIHVQSSSLATRPIAGVAGRKWITADTGVYNLWYDDGSVWHEVSNSTIEVEVLADANLVAGDVVKITGYNNGQGCPTVNKVSSAADVAFGIVDSAISLNTKGYIINTGIARDINTNAFTVGTILYPNTSGGLTSTKPTSGSYQVCAYVLRQNVNNGVLFVEFSGARIVESSSNTANTVVLRDGSGNFTAGTVTATLTGNATTATALSSARTFALTGDITGSVSSDLTSGASIAATIASGVIVDADINASAAIVDTKLATISTAGKVSNTATTATNLNTANAIVARDASGNFSAGTITANLTGNASGSAATVTGAAQTAITSVGTLTGLTSSGTIAVGGNAIAAGRSITLNTAAGNVRSILIQSAGVNRFGISVDGAPESGSDLGSALQVNVYSDAGVVSNIFSVLRASGSPIQWSRPLAVRTTTASQLRVEYDATNYLTVNITASGSVAFSTNDIVNDLFSFSSSIAVDGATPTTATGLLTKASTTSKSSLRVPHGSAPSSPVDGDMWTTTAGLFVRINGATVGPLS